MIANFLSFLRYLFQKLSADFATINPKLVIFEILTSFFVDVLGSGLFYRSAAGFVSSMNTTSSEI